MKTSTILSKLFFTVSLAVLTTTYPTINTHGFDPSSIITRDVCVIGGGSAGTYSAIRLHDEGKSVVIIEAQDRLGGHTQTYTDPTANETVDYGVVVFHNISIVNNYFARFNIPLTIASLGQTGQTSTYVDFRTGKAVSGYTPSNPTAALAAYAAQLAQYPYLEAGFELPDPVPADLLLPFGDFVTKYALQDMIALLFQFAQGLGDLLSQLTLYVFKNFGLGILQGVQTGFLTTLNQDNSEIYVKALDELRENVLLETQILAIDRSAASSGGSVKVLVRTARDGVKLVVAKKLMVAILPKLDNLKGFDLSTAEQNLFKQFQNSAYYTGLLRNANIPDTSDVVNIGIDTQYNLPVLPAVYSFMPTRVPGLLDVKYGSKDSLSSEQVRTDILKTLGRIIAAETLNSTTTTKADFAVFASHTPFELTVPKESIEGGFYKRLYALQGTRGTWYTGAAWHTQDSSLLWAFTEGVLKRVLEGL